MKKNNLSKSDKMHKRNKQIPKEELDIDSKSNNIINFSANNKSRSKKQNNSGINYLFSSKKKVLFILK